MAASNMMRVSSNGSSQSATSGVTDVWANPNILVDLDSEVALPNKWKQCLDVQTGEVYFINEKGQRTKIDPRKPIRSVKDFDGGEEVNSYAKDDDDDDVHVLVLAGCKKCIMYCMMPKHLNRCLKCNGRLLRFDGY